MNHNQEFKSGFVALVGVPNAGKSSLVNRLVGESVSVVTAKPQTTRFRTFGILNGDDYQVVWIDTPGIVENAKGLNPILKEELKEALKDVDVVVAAVAPWELKSQETPWILTHWEGLKDKAILIITQSDKISLEDRVQFIKICEVMFGRTPLFTSSVTEHGLSDLKNDVIKLLKPGPKFFEDDIYTPQTMREIAAEVIRKYCFEFLHQEVPYGLTVIVREFLEKPIYEISADIIVSKSSHKGIVIGKGGASLKNIGSSSRHELERLLGRKVFLKLHVIVRENWIQDRSILRESGFKNA